jgi:hypothetical protein
LLAFELVEKWAVQKDVQAQVAEWAGSMKTTSRFEVSNLSLCYTDSSNAALSIDISILENGAVQ